MPSRTIPIPSPNRQSGKQRPYSQQQTETPPLSPHSFRNSVDDDLSLRCRKLARSWGEDAVTELTGTTNGDDLLSPHPRGSISPHLSPLVTASGSNNVTSGLLLLSPLSPRAALPPTPDGGFVLEEISEEREEEEASSALFPLTVAQASGIVGTALSTDDEASDRESSTSRSRRSSWTRSDSFGSRPHRSPLQTALNKGANNVVVDVWLLEGELLVGTELATLSLEDTLSALYLDPLLHLLGGGRDQQESPSRHRRQSSVSAFNQITKTTPFHLILTLQSEPSITFQYLLHALTPLRDALLLTSFCPNSNLVTPSFITVLCTGGDAHIPWADIMALSPRYVFAELAWANLGKRMTEKEARELTPAVVVELKQTGWDGVTPAVPTEEVKQIIKQHVEEAHAKGLVLRYADLPRWPIHARELVKSALHDLGVDLV